MINKPKRPKENFLLKPNHIRNNSALGWGEKDLYSHIYSFGRKGCWQSNETLGKMFFRKPRTISLWVANLKKAGLILWLHPKGYYRTLWAKAHPEVAAAQSLLYRSREISKAAVISGQAKSVLLSNNLQSNCAGNCEATAQKPVVPLRKKLLHTNNTTTKENIEGTTATPAPLPAGGQASALLDDRKAAQAAKIERTKRNFGSARTRRKLTEAEFEQRRQRVLADLRSGKK